MNLAYTIQAAQDRHRMRPVPVDPGTVRQPRRPEAPAIEPPKLRLVHDVERPIVQSAPRPKFMAKVGHAITQAFNFCLVVVIITASFWSGAGLGKFEDDWEIRQHAAALMADHSLPAPLPQIGEFDRENGRAK